MNQYAIEIDGLSKSFDREIVLSNVEMKLPYGRIVGWIGRNGSGKTLLMKLILGFAHPTNGIIRIRGRELGKDMDTPEHIGAIIETPGFLPNMSGFKNLKLLAMIQGKIDDAQIKNSMCLVGLDPDSKKHVGKYSLGMRQRLGIAQALMENPDILLLDEPLSGLDNEGVAQMYKVLLELKHEGKLIVIASHSKEDIHTLCDEIYSFDQGRIIEHDLCCR